MVVISSFLFSKQEMRAAVVVVQLPERSYISFLVVVVAEVAVVDYDERVSLTDCPPTICMYCYHGQHLTSTTCAL